MLFKYKVTSHWKRWSIKVGRDLIDSYQASSGLTWLSAHTKCRALKVNSYAYQDFVSRDTVTRLGSELWAAGSHRYHHGWVFVTMLNGTWMIFRMTQQESWYVVSIVQWLCCMCYHPGAVHFSDHGVCGVYTTTWRGRPWIGKSAIDCILYSVQDVVSVTVWWFVFLEWLWYLNIWVIYLPKLGGWMHEPGSWICGSGTRVWLSKLVLTIHKTPIQLSAITRWACMSSNDWLVQ